MSIPLAALVIAAATAAPERVLTTPSGHRRVEIALQRAEETWRYGPHPRERAYADVTDPRDGRHVARVTLGWSVAGTLLAADGLTLVVLDVGYRSQRADEALPRALGLVDLETGTERARVDLPYRTLRLDDPVPDPSTGPPRHKLMLSADGSAALVFADRERAASGRKLPPELMIVDLRTAALRVRVELPAGAEARCATAAPEGGVVLPVWAGDAYDLLSADTATGALETIALGAPTTFDIVIGGDTLYVFASRRGGRTRDEVRAPWMRRLEGGRLGPAFSVPGFVEPVRLSADGRRLALFGYDRLAIVELETGKVLRQASGRRRFARDLTLEELLAGEPGFARAPEEPAAWPWSASANSPTCPWIATVARGLE